MYRYICIESKEDIKLYEATIISLFSEFINFTDIKVINHHIWMYYQHDIDVSLKDVILNLSQDTLVDFRLYQSYKYETKKSLEDHKKFMSQKLAEISFNAYAFIDDQIIVKHFINSLDQSFKYYILKKYSQNQMMIETVKIYLESNQNMSLAAKSLYVHRNTLIQRLDKFHQVTGFDVKSFTDGFLIYHLLLIK
ncbi:MAG: helix-turn-helix domain-containing protein [Acholeplasmataceae bacterium]|nr:helix-turn-helix domain-containing protein [Acholeplasmataceae bacterium]